VVSFTPRPLYPQGKSPQYLLDRALGTPEPVWTPYAQYREEIDVNLNNKKMKKK
jgi:hypothetical protein